MKCKQIQELLKADYLDGEINQKKQQYIKEHLAECPQCRKLEQELQAQRALFKKTGQMQAPERVWQNVRDAIISENLNQEGIETRGIFQRLRDSILTPRPVVALASAITAIIVVIVAATIIQNGQFLSRENGDGMFEAYSLNGENGYLLYDLGTSIEEYFL